VNRRLTIVLGLFLLLFAVLAVSTVAGDSSVAPTDCFSGDGFELTIGDNPGIHVRLHISLVTDLGNPGEYGVELAGTYDGDTITTLAAGVRLDDPRAVASSNPIEAFDIIGQTEIHLPFDDHVDGPSVEVDDPSVESDANTTTC